MSFIKHASNNTFAQGFSAVFLLLVGVITARVLGPDGRGVYALFFTTAGLLSQLLYLGLTQASVYFQNREPRPYNQIFTNCMVFLLAQAVLLAVALPLLRHQFGDLLSHDEPAVIMILLWVSTLTLLAELLFMGLALGKHYYGLYSLDLLCMSGGILISTVGAVMFPDNLDMVIAIRVAVMLLVMAAFYFKLVKSSAPSIDYSFSVLKEQIRFGFKNYSINLINNLNFRIYIYFLAALTGNAAAGLFSVAMLFCEPLRLMPNSLGPILFAHLSKDDSLESNAMMTARVCRMIFCASALGMLVYIPVIPYLLRFVFGDQYDGIELASVFVALGGLLGITFQILSRFFTSRHLQRYTLLASIVAFFVAIALSLWLIPAYGLMGAAIAFSGSTLVSTSITLCFFLRITKLSMLETLFIQRVDCSDVVDLLSAVIAKRGNKS